MKYAELISQMTLEEKVSLLSGADSWHTEAIERLGIPAIMVADGPHGLRKQTAECVGVHDSVKATCFPTAVTTASSWDEGLVRELGKALAEECLAEKVAVVLGPGANIKRSPLCGRNFEYYSEDPLLAGHMAGAFIAGVEAEGVGTSLKHFACNSQEERRFVISSTIDMRTMREIYLTQFEIAVKASNPRTMMCSYNKINNVYSSENPLILTDILRSEWGYDGVVMSDWGAVNDRDKGVYAGLDLEMPSSNGINDKYVIDAVNSGRLDIAYVDKAVDNMLTLIFEAKSHEKDGYTYDVEEHNDISERIATEGAVLLKNDNNILPLDKGKKILVLGALAEHPRYQGAGSSHINAHKITSLLAGLDALGVAYEYAPGYTLDSTKSSKKARTYAIDRAKDYDTILVCIGLTDEYEAEGFDRSTLSLPTSQIELLDELAKVGKKVVVDIECGSPITMPWLEHIDGALLSYLGGQATGGAAAKLLYGDINPSGKLAETFPMSLEDTPCYRYFPGDGKSVQYREGVYVGYRYYTTANVPTLFPFGYGMSYTTFSYDSIDMASSEYHVGDKVQFTVNVTNTGSRKGKEIIQIYISPKNAMIDRPLRELKAFKKVEIEAGESVAVTFTLDDRAFSYYDISTESWVVDKGAYDIIAAKNVLDSSLVASVEFLDGNTTDHHLRADSWYNHPSPSEVPDADFVELLGAELPAPMVYPKKGEYTRDHSFADMMETSGLARKMSRFVRFVLRKATHVKDNDPGLEMAHKSFIYAPLRSMPALSGGVLSDHGIDGILTVFNGHFFRGVHMILSDLMAQNKAKKAKEKAKAKK